MLVNLGRRDPLFENPVLKHENQLMYFMIKFSLSCNITFLWNNWIQTDLYTCVVCFFTCVTQNKNTGRVGWIKPEWLAGHIQPDTKTKEVNQAKKKANSHYIVIHKKFTRQPLTINTRQYLD